MNLDLSGRGRAFAGPRRRVRSRRRAGAPMMWAMSETIRVNFGKPIPLFPLPDTVLLPHAILPLHIFEPRYRRMVGTCLDGPGQIAIGTFERAESSRTGGSIPVRLAVCIGQIIHHDALPDGCYNILLHGVCRAKIRQIIEPESDRPYRMAKLVPLERVDETPVKRWNRSAQPFDPSMMGSQIT